MKVSIVNSFIKEGGDIDFLVIPIFCDKKQEKLENIFLINKISKLIDFNVLYFMKEKLFFGKKEHLLFLRSLKVFKSILFIGCGVNKNITINQLKIFGAKVISYANFYNAKNVYFVCDSILNVDYKQVVFSILYGAILAKYKFNKYLTKKKEESFILTFCLIVKKFSEISFMGILKKVKAICKGTYLARDLINESPSVLNPKEFSTRSMIFNNNKNIKVVVFDEDFLKKEKMNLILGVARASLDFTPPRLIEIIYKPKDCEKHIVLVGKGLTFDSGGLDLKSSDNMRYMKFDMSGAATVLGVMCSVGILKPKVAITGYLACVENSINEKAYHPGDVLISRKGISVEIDNTDAEGRLVLADVFDYVQDKDRCDILIDLATLTGASMVALGLKIGALYSNNDKLAIQLDSCSKSKGEKFWRMPLDKEMRNQLKSSIADIKNCGTKFGGSITAALFLEEFIKKKTLWAHLDIAGPAATEKEHAYLSEGGCGFAVGTLVEFIMSQ